MDSDASRHIALSLSGGGIRAMAFHLGVLTFLAERTLLEEIHRLSTVSGGSLLIGLLLNESGMQWPSSPTFLADIYPQLRMKLCARSLQWGAARQLRNPTNWRFLLSRANLLGQTLRNDWGVQSTLADLPLTPEWSINGTTAENGKRFRFKRSDLGDYTLGYASGGAFPLSDAMAVSAAFPGGFGPLRVEAKKFDWRKRPWDAPVESEKSVGLGFEALHLYDGGVYDNLGLEPFFDAGRGTSKQPGSYIVVSDAGSPLPDGFSFRSLSPLRLKRVADIMSDQSHSLRVRTFANYLQQGDGRGAFLYIKAATQSGSDAVAFATTFPTTLRKLSLHEFDQLSGHGYAVSTEFERQYGFYQKLAEYKFQ